MVPRWLGHIDTMFVEQFDYSFAPFDSYEVGLLLAVLQVHILWVFNPLYAYDFFHLAWYNEFGMAYCAYQGGYLLRNKFDQVAVIQPFSNINLPRLAQNTLLTFSQGRVRKLCFW